MGDTITKTKVKKSLKRLIDQLKSKQSRLKEEHKKLNKELDKASSKKSKKKKAKSLKSDLEKLVEKKSSVKKRLTKAKSKFKKLKAIQGKEDKTMNNHTDVEQAALEQLSPLTDLTEGKDADRQDELNRKSIDFNAKEAISIIKQIASANELTEFILKDSRITVLKAATSRQNAITQSEGSH